MTQEWAQRQLAARLAERAKLIESELVAGERILDCGDVNELAVNTLADLGAGESLLFVTDRRLILYRTRNSESFPYRAIERFRLQRAPRGAPQRRVFRQLTLHMDQGGIRGFLGGQMFLTDVKSILRRYTA